MNGASRHPAAAALDSGSDAEEGPVRVVVATPPVAPARKAASTPASWGGAAYGVGWCGMRNGASTDAVP